MKALKSLFRFIVLFVLIVAGAVFMSVNAEKEHQGQCQELGLECDQGRAQHFFLRAQDEVKSWFAMSKKWFEKEEATP